MTETPSGRDGTPSATDPDETWTPGTSPGRRQARPKPMPAGNGPGADALGAVLFLIAILLVIAIGFGVYH